ncbi:MAG TPA: carboxypeptidase-like regulatory domain-containing protein [Thermoanaerobaculia bacterium]
MIKRKSLTVAVGILIALGSTSAMAQSSIGGTVRGPAGQALQGMAVAVFNVAGTSSFGAVTDAQGRYNVALSPGDYRVLAYDPNGVYATRFFPNADSFEASAILTLASGDRLTTIDFQLERAGRVTGRVTDVNGVALQGMTVAAYNPSGSRREFTTTSSTGQYSLVLPSGPFRIAAYDNNLDFVTEFFSETPDFDAAVTLEVDEGETIATIDFTLARGAKITGRIIDANTLAPLSGKTAAVYDLAGNEVMARNSTSDGMYGLAVLPGTYRLLAFDSDGVYATSYYQDAEAFERSTELELRVGDAFVANLTMVRGGRVSGRVSARGSTVPLRNMVVAAYNLSGYRRGFVRTDAAGDYSILLPPGQYKFAVYDEGLGYTTIFYDNAKTFESAGVLLVSSGSSAPGVDFLMDSASASRRRRPARRP